MTNQWSWKHYTVASTSTKDLLEYYKSSSYKNEKKIRTVMRKNINIKCLR